MSHALETGVRLLLGTENDKKILKKTIKDLQIQMDYYNQRLEIIEKAEAEKVLTAEKARQIAADKQKFFKDQEPTFKIAGRVLARERNSFGSVYDYWRKMNDKHQEIFNEPLNQETFIGKCKECNHG
jgi:deoxyribodipyrimidine photolyase